MTKKILVAVISIVFILFLGGLIAFYVLYGQNDGASPNSSNPINLFPFGSGNQQNQSTTLVDTTTPDGKIPRLRQLTSAPTSGMTIYRVASSTIVRYVERATGHIYEIDLTKPAPTRRISNTTIPKISQALFSASTTVLLRYAGDGDRLENFLAQLASSTDRETKEGSVTGIYVAGTINDIALSPLGNQLLTTNVSNNGTAFIRSGTGGEKPATIFTNPLREWNIEWPATSTAVITTRPSASSPGYSYLLGMQNGSLRKILGGIRGLTVRSNSDASTMLYSGSSERAPVLGIYTPKTDEVVPTTIATLPEKCVFSQVNKSTAFCGVPQNIPSGEYPDVWYQGAVSFSDSLWQLNTQDGTATVIGVPENLRGVSIDVLYPQISTDGSFMVFINKKDGSLWSFAINY